MRGECSQAPQLPFPSVEPDTGSLLSLRSRLCERSCGNKLRSLESQREVPGRVAQTHPETMAVDSGLSKLLEKVDDGIARVRFHSIFASRPALITIVYQTSVNIATMTVTASQTGAEHVGGDGATADAGLWTNEHHSNDLANVHGPALCLGARACIAAFLHPHLIVSLLTFLVMLAHSSTSVPSSEKGEQLSRRSSRTSRGDGETFEQPRQSRPSWRGQRRVLYGALLDKDPSPVVRKERAGAHSGSRSRSSSVLREAVRHGHDPTVSKLAGWADGHPGVLSARILQTRSNQRGRDCRRRDWLPEECPPVRIMFTRSCGLSFRAWARGTAASWTPSGKIIGSPGRWRDRHIKVQGRRNGSHTTAIGLEPPIWSFFRIRSGSSPSRDEEELIARELRDEMKLKRYLDDAVGTKNKDRSMLGDKRELRGQGPGEGEGCRKSDVSGNLTAVDGTGSEGVDCELAGGLDALMLDAFGASVLDDACAPGKGDAAGRRTSRCH